MLWITSCEHTLPPEGLTCSDRLFADALRCPPTTYRYAFRTPALIPLVSSLGLASARLDNVLIDTPPPTLLPPLTETLDLQVMDY